MFCINTKTLTEIQVVGSAGILVYFLDIHNQMKHIHIDTFKQDYKQISQ